MKLALKIDNVYNLRKILGFILSFRKQCIFKFTLESLIIISIDQESPMVWNTIESSNFTRYDVISKEEIISLEINAEPLFQILKNYEKAPSASELSIKLQRDEVLNSNINKRRSVSLAVAYNEDVTCSTEINHSFTIPANLLRAKTLEKIQMPITNDISIIIDLNASLIPFFMRVERYKDVELVNVVTNKLGEFRIDLEDDSKKISIKWKSFLDTYKANDTDYQQNIGKSTHRDKDSMTKEITVRVKSRWWNYVSKLIDMCGHVQMHIYEDGCVFTCHVEDEQSYLVVYYLPGKLV